jgi:acetoin utilization deacetylase AcuC-like enzyme
LTIQVLEKSENRKGSAGMQRLTVIILTIAWIGAVSFSYAKDLKASLAYLPMLVENKNTGGYVAFLKAIDEVMAGNIDNAFCAVRPPGHHAEVDKPMGFCYFNNVAIGARYLQKQYGIEKVGIIDFDVHHGNGTQHIFDQDPTVYYYSIHEHPSFAYPGTGREFETGVGNGSGYTLNSPVLPGRGDEEYRKKMTRDLVPAFKKFKPDFILVSAGFDAHVTDLMSGTNLTTDGYDFVSEVIVNLVNTLTDGKVVSVLEGGYNLDILPLLVENHIKLLADLRR